VPAVENRFGIELPDPYRWMESGEAEVAAWLRAQGEYSAHYLSALPGRDELFRRIRELGLGTSSISGLQLGGGSLFYEYVAPGEQLPRLMVRRADGKERLLVDPLTLGERGTHASINSYSSSPDGKLVAFNVSQRGSELSSIQVMEVETGKRLPDTIERIWGEFAASWLPDGRAFFYTQLGPPAPGADPMLHMQARLHRLGEPVQRDVAVLGESSTRMKVAAEEFPEVSVQPGTRWMVASAGGAHSETRLAVARVDQLDLEGTGATPWTTVAEYSDGVESWAVRGDRLYLLTYKDAPNRRLVSVPLARPELAHARVEIPEDPAATLVAVAAARDGLYLLRAVEGRARVERWRDGARTLELPFPGWVRELATDPLRDGVTLSLEGWTRPPVVLASDGDRLQPTGLAATTTADHTAVVADEVEVDSAGGARVPLTIIHRRDLHAPSSPAILWGYGGYGNSQRPSFSPTRLAWIERGGVFAIAHVRGGGEKGRAWQDAGSRQHKMNGIRDFLACGQYLVDRQWTAPSRLAAAGGSMGGVLVGRAITLRPELFAAANIAVGLVNPLHILVAPNGANQKVELGDPDTAEGYRSILEFDPYFHLQASTVYPATLFTIGLNDRRVAPWMTAKMAARMQAIAPARPALIRVDADSGHGVGSTRDQMFAERADVWSFFLAQFAAGSQARLTPPPDAQRPPAASAATSVGDRARR
jgi:prolyl oligopeptidase